jgi:hypothetical protein
MSGLANVRTFYHEEWKAIGSRNGERARKTRKKEHALPATRLVSKRTLAARQPFAIFALSRDLRDPMFSLPAPSQTNALPLHPIYGKLSE